MNDRRTFLRRSALVAGAAAASPLLKLPAFATTPRDGASSPRRAGIQPVFDNTDKPGATAEGPEAQPMADQMSETFIAFARTGDPNNRAIPRRERYQPPRRRTLVFDVPSHAEDDPRGAGRRLFAKVPYVQPGT